MSRRSLSLTVATVALGVLVAVALLVPVPYVVMSPGPTENTLGAFDGKPIITIKGHRVYDTTGHLNMTTVSVSKPSTHIRLAEVLHAWWDGDQIVLPRDVVYPPDQTVKQVQKQSKQEMVGSQSAAVVAGLGEAGIDALHTTITSVTSGAPAQGVFRKGDDVVSVDGTKVADAAALAQAVGSLKPGTKVAVGVVRDGAKRTLHVTTEASPDDASKSRIGVRLEDEYDPPFKVNFDLGQKIGGPSAGMMFSLGIYDKVTKGQLTGGRFVAGTGTIDPAGEVGQIGGIQQKIAGAQAAGATVFLVPAGNCKEAADSSVAGKVELIKVSTLDQAIKSLHALGSDDQSAITHCG
ncbi:MAG: YlbL family protein [Nocardioidaceae bacterium]